MHAALVKLQAYGAGNLGLAMIDRRLKHLALRREPEAVVDQFRITRHQFVLEVRRAAIQRQLLDPAMRREQNGAARRFIHAARLHADEAILDQIESSDGVPLAITVQCFQQRSEELRVGKECVSTCRSRWWPYH